MTVKLVANYYFCVLDTLIFLEFSPCLCVIVVTLVCVREWCVITDVFLCTHRRVITSPQLQQLCSLTKPVNGDLFMGGQSSPVCEWDTRAPDTQDEVLKVIHTLISMIRKQIDQANLGLCKPKDAKDIAVVWPPAVVPPVLQQPDHPCWRGTVTEACDRLDGAATQGEL